VTAIQILNPGTGYASEKPLLIGIDPPPLTARLNLNDPMVVKNLSLNTSSSSGPNTTGGGFGASKNNNNKNKYTKNDEIYDPSSMNAKAWKMPKIGDGEGSVGRACYDDPVVAYGHPVADVDSYSSFRSGNTSGNDNDSGTNPGGGGTREKISASITILEWRFHCKLIFLRLELRLNNNKKETCGE
jgi:hypothetical protein